MSSVYESFFTQADEWKRFIRLAVISFAVLSAAMFGGVVMAACARSLPDLQALNSYVPRQSIYIYDANGELLTNINDQGNRIVVPLERISPNLKLSVLAIEDRDFYSHAGVNPKSIVRALIKNVSGGKISEGGSTLTMQLVKNLYLSPERKITRKIIEAVLAMRIERVLDKDKILELYLNQIYWGHNQCGAEAAARNFFGKSAETLSLGEASMMAGLIQAPEAYSPFMNPEFSKQRQEKVLRSLVELKWISEEEAKAALEEKLNIDKLNAGMSHAPYVTDAVLCALNDRFGKEVVALGDLYVQTTFDLKMQRAAQNVVRRGYDRLRGQGVKAEQIALVAIDPQTHFIKAMVGGVDFYRSQFNRALNSYRQPGSVFKPFVYYTALASGRWYPEDIILDSPVTYVKWGQAYSPRNYDGGFYGAITLRRALAASRNIPVVRLGVEVGIDKVVQTCKDLGISQPMYPAPSLALGTVDISPAEIANAYATFASGGWYCEPNFIFQVKNRHGHVLWDNTPQQKLVLDPDACANLTSMLQTVVDAGTGAAARLADRPAAGKTGTTSSERDVWFVGYTPQLSCAIWVGNDDNQTLGHRITGGGYVAPLWREFMTEALKGTPPLKFPEPPPPPANHHSFDPSLNEQGEVSGSDTPGQSPGSGPTAGPSQSGASPSSAAQPVAAPAPPKPQVMSPSASAGEDRSSAVPAIQLTIPPSQSLPSLRRLVTHAGRVRVA